ncbi:MAG: hypothetical protein NTV46_05050 [Verrucomicrobia bacterium]|nr:hypothetical protein [Verrucomicrobiota bacterium]
MEKRVSKKHQQMAAPEWVFHWRRLRGSTFHKASILLAVGGVFAFFLTSVNIRLAPPTPWAARKASVFFVTDDAAGRALTLRAREGGPFPSRFDPSEWEHSVVLEQTALQAARWTPPPYVPVLRDLPDRGFDMPLPLATRGVPVLPIRSLPVVDAPISVKLKLVPVLDLLSGMPAAAMPRELPPFDGTVDATMAAEPWRVLVRLDSAGNVRECISLVGGDGVGSSPLENWLRRVSFIPAPAQPSRWIAVSVGFTNQPADGPDAR